MSQMKQNTTITWHMFKQKNWLRDDLNSQRIFTSEDYPESLLNPYPIGVSPATFNRGSLAGGGKGGLGRRHLPDGYTSADSRPWSYAVTAILSAVLVTFPPVACFTTGGKGSACQHQICTARREKGRRTTPATPCLSTRDWKVS